MATSEESVRARFHRAGLNYARPIIADGKLRRFKAEGEKARDSWYVRYQRPAAGAFGCWRRGFKETWSEKSPEDYTAAEFREVRARWKRADDAERLRHEQARKTAAWIVNRANQARTDHPYLKRKGVKAYGQLLEYRGALVQPLRDAKGELRSLQFIGQDGGKKFLTGGQVKGCFFALAEKPEGPLVICEGCATGAATICAMNCGNLSAVAEALRAQWPTREIIVGADNDEWKEGNAGMTKGLAAAKAIGAKLAVPKFKDTTTKPTDFNDLQVLEGFKTVNDQIEAATVPVEADDERFERLAKLTPAEYDRVLDDEAKRARVRVSTLDDEVTRRRPKSNETLQGGALVLESPEPWPEAVNGADALSETSEMFSRDIVLPEGGADVLALWSTPTRCFDSFPCTPRFEHQSAG
jgi:putative DNA primase/helicase